MDPSGSKEARSVSTNILSSYIAKPNIAGIISLLILKASVFFQSKDGMNLNPHRKMAGI
jgi:hypothetical protein